jgi:O-succinylbenzoic acid--CoA ligase
VSALAALDLPAGPAFVDALRAVWDRGDAAFPLDPRLPPAARADALAATRPATVIGPGGEARWEGDTEPSADGDALVVTTSGSTGRPKAVVLTHAALAAHARAVHERLGVDPARDRWLACLPLAHMGGLGVVVRSLVGGVGLDVVAGPDPTVVAAAPRELGSTLVSLVPTALDRVDAAGYRWIVLGGSSDGARRSSHVVRTYGLTESGGGVVYSHGGPLTGTEVRVVDGEVQLRGPTLLRCYRDGTDPRTGDGWLATGDLGELVDGELSVRGRRDEMIVSGGENVWPTAVEAALDRHPGVREAAVVGRADVEWGQRVVALVVPADPAKPPTLDELRDAVRDVLPAAAAPRQLELVERLPRSALGKLRRDSLG